MNEGKDPHLSTDAELDGSHELPITEYLLAPQISAFALPIGGEADEILVDEGVSVALPICNRAVTWRMKTACWNKPWLSKASNGGEKLSLSLTWNATAFTMSSAARTANLDFMRACFFDRHAAKFMFNFACAKNKETGLSPDSLGEGKKCYADFTPMLCSSSFSYSSRLKSASMGSTSALSTTIQRRSMGAQSKSFP